MYDKTDVIYCIFFIIVLILAVLVGAILAFKFGCFCIRFFDFLWLG